MESINQNSANTNKERSTRVVKLKLPPGCEDKNLYEIFAPDNKEMQEFLKPAKEKFLRWVDALLADLLIKYFPPTKGNPREIKFLIPENSRFIENNLKELQSLEKFTLIQSLTISR